MRVADLETPALLIDLDIMERNLKRVADYAAEHRLRLRPHTKTHKTPALGRRQLDLGAAGLTVAKVGEAEVMLSANPDDILLAYPVIGKGKLERLAALARKTRLTVALDSLFAARKLSEAASGSQVNVGVLAEVDAGFHRVGVSPGEELIGLIRDIEKLPHLDFEGVAFYPGHIKKLDDEGLRAIDTLADVVRSMLEDLGRAGIEPRIVSGGSTPTLFHSHRLEGVNEIRPGTYIFNDKNTVAVGACKLEDCAASMLNTVISTARPGQVIIDGGSKTFSSDRLTTSSNGGGFGYIVEDPDSVFYKMNEEHGYVDIKSASRKFSIGDRLRVIPNHICVAVNLHEKLYGVRGEDVEEVWKVEGRGKLQ
jgi:D-serine deaminase-like pyridoxal phosphate-dependent protein